MSNTKDLFFYSANICYVIFWTDSAGISELSQAQCSWVKELGSVPRDACESCECRCLLTCCSDESPNTTYDLQLGPYSIKVPEEEVNNWFCRSAACCLALGIFTWFSGMNWELEATLGFLHGKLEEEPNSPWEPATPGGCTSDIEEHSVAFILGTQIDPSAVELVQVV